MNTELATFGAGCFWQVEAEFRKLDGVIDTSVGYEGGEVENPTYEQVCSSATGHVEVCQIEFDPAKLGYEELLASFFELHDPTQVDRQGPDVGPQYRSVIFAHSDEQAEKARIAIEGLEREIGSRVATRIEPAQPFWPAEEYHQCYLEKRSSGLGGIVRQAFGV